MNLGREITRLEQDMVERTPRWEGKKEQKKMTKPVVRVEEAKENLASGETTPRVGGNQEDNSENRKNSPRGGRSQGKGNSETASQGGGSQGEGNSETILWGEGSS